MRRGKSTQDKKHSLHRVYRLGYIAVGRPSGRLLMTPHR
ncbi:hypothetical protein GP5015_1010 [gamma proteobacterium HTCC5015]|nr:hypothetical protein GP5015_1010 [gamma proteobacterium HTCC5015]